jgi:hypothetical protein
MISNVAFSILWVWFLLQFDMNCRAESTNSTLNEEIAEVGND